MCGIGGIYSPSWAVGFPAGMACDLWTNLSDRGGHACGFATLENDSKSVKVHKWEGESFDHEDALYEALNEHSRYVMLHTRFTTQGSTKNMGNNHPITTNRIVSTHNGVLWNDDDIFDRLGSTRFNEVDSEALNVSLRLMSPKWMIENNEGSISLAWVDLDKPEIVHLITNGNNPLVIGRLLSGHIVWASTERHMEESFGDMLSDNFLAVPFKQYTLNPDGAIRSEFISGFRAKPNAQGYQRGFRYWREQ